MARVAAEHVLASHTSEDLAHTIMLLPTRRSIATLRDAFATALNGRASLLPRMIALGDLALALPSLLPARHRHWLAVIPPAMGRMEHRYLLARYAAVFERARMGQCTAHYALSLADSLLTLQEDAIRYGADLNPARIRGLMYGDHAKHWQDGLEFLAILSEHWPTIEKETGKITQAAHERLLIHGLANHWRDHPPAHAVYALGSTASQPATAQLLTVIAAMPRGHVILTGFDGSIDADEWQAIAPGHPLYYPAQWLQHQSLTPDAVVPLAEPHPRASLWRESLASPHRMAQWRSQALPDYQHLRLIPCIHPEEEARLVSLIIREGLEHPARTVALITPDEGFMAQVSAHLKRYGVIADRLNAGSLATTLVGSLWLALVRVIATPSDNLAVRHLLNHSELGLDAGLLQALEPGWHGVSRRRPGQLPGHDPSLTAHAQYAQLVAWLKQLLSLQRREYLASAWIEQLQGLLHRWDSGDRTTSAAITETIAQMEAADGLGPLAIEEFTALLLEHFAAPTRMSGLRTHPRLRMLTPVEARLAPLDRVILARMDDHHWPGHAPANPWLNQAAQQAIGLPSHAEHISLMAHDLLLLGSAPEVFCTYARRDSSGPTTRSRFLERLVTLLASHGVDEAAIAAPSLLDWANRQYACDTLAPEPPIAPRPPADLRPRRLPASQIDRLFTDPFSIYARYVLGLKPLRAINAEPEASDFGSLTHRAIEALTHYWNAHERPADDATLEAIAAEALRHVEDRSAIDLFWRTRLMGGLRYINGLENERRRAEPLSVAAEQLVEATLTLPGGETITLHGTIDRIEESASRGRVVIDHKTGKIPSENEILEGRALQLMVYAILLNAHNSTVTGDIASPLVNAAAPVSAIEYWQLPKLGEEGMIRSTAIHERIDVLEEKLKTALLQMLDPTTPFLARPVPSSNDERYGNDYDGISRYDEWAG